MGKNWYSQLPKGAKPALWSLFLGWMMDVYDVYLVAFLGLIIARVYLAPYLGAGAYVQAVYAAGALTATLVARAVGAMIFGPVADRRGRKGPLMASLLGYSLFTVLTAFTVELVKPFLYGASLALGVITLFVAFRIAAGIFLGGEWTVGAPYASELLPPEVRARATAFMQAGAPLGQLLAALVPFILAGLMGNTAFSAFGWRVTFVLGALPALLAIYIRRSLPESKVWAEAHDRSNKLRVQWKRTLHALMINVGMFTCVYAVVASYGNYIEELYGSSTYDVLSFRASASFMLLIVISLVGVVSTLLFGQLGDRWGRKRGLLLAAIGFIALSPFVAPFWIEKPGLGYLMLISSIYSFFVGSTGILPSYVSELISDATGRATGATAYNGNLLLTGWVPSLIPILGRVLIRAPISSQFAIGMTIFSFIGGAVLLTFTAFGPETRGLQLR
ncbi:MFS transporter [Tardisphaera saccharovorans]